MSLSNIQNQGVPIGNLSQPKKQKTTKRVADIILNKNHAAYTGPDSIGIIFFTDEKTQEHTNDTTTLPRAKPLSLNNFTTPLIGELVNITQSTSNDYYPDLGGNPNLTSNYYSPTINVWNNAGSNAVPLDKRTGKGNKKDKTRQSSPNFEFEKEFRTSGAQEVASKMCGNYLRNLGYPSGRNDPNAPIYKLFQDNNNGDFILRLEDSEENKAKLGSYYKENPNQSNLNLTEGGTVNQGKNGQRISFSANDKAHQGPGSGLGGLEQNRAMVLSLGDGETENINNDDGTIHLATNQKVNIKTSSNLIASLHSKYIPHVEPLEQIEKKPAIAIPTTNPTPELQVQDLFSGLGGTVEEATPIIISSASVDPFSDPVFDALDEAIEEGHISEEEFEDFEVSGTVHDPITESPDNEEPTSSPVIPEEDETTKIQEHPDWNRTNIISNLDPDTTGNKIWRKKNYHWFGLKSPSKRPESSTQPFDSTHAGRKKRNAKNGIYHMNQEATEQWLAGNFDKGVYSNQKGNLYILRPPTKIFTMKKSTRDITHICIHCTAGWHFRTPAHSAKGFFSRYIEPDKEGLYRHDNRYWSTVGYHWMILEDGSAVRMLDDKQVSNGVKGLNSKAININWIGGLFAGSKSKSKEGGVDKHTASKRQYSFGSKNLEGTSYQTSQRCENQKKNNTPTKAQALSLYKLLKAYIDTYPNIKIMGHNQMSTKICPLFHVPTFVREVGLPHSNTDDDLPVKDSKGRSNKPHNEYLDIPNNYFIENAKFLAASIL